MQNLRKRFLKIVGKILLVLIGIGIALQITGYGHVITAVKKSILIGQFGPRITDLDIFPSRKIEAAPSPWNWTERKELAVLNEEENSFHEDIKSTSFMVLWQDSVVLEKYWSGGGKETYTNSFSMAKSVIGSLCAIAVSEGKVSWEDEISKYLPDYKNKEIGAITFAELLSMSAATDWTESGGNPFSDNARAYYGDDLVETISNTKANGNPGEVFHYQSGNTALAAYALSNAVGKSISAYAEEKIWSVIGTEYPAYWSLDAEDGIEKAFCCYYAVTQDFAKLGRLWLRKGTWDSTQVIPTVEMEYMTQPYTKDFGPCKEACYGVSFWLENYRGYDLFYARGILGQYIIVIPELDLLIVRTGKTRMAKTERYHPEDLYEYIDQALRLIDINEERH